MSIQKRLRELIAYAEAMGITGAVVHKGSKHPQLRGMAPSGKRVRVTLAGSPRNSRWGATRERADLRRALRP
jgi:hypothetical protein